MPSILYYQSIINKTFFIFTLRDYLDFSIIVPVAVGAYRFKNIDFVYKLLCCYLCVAAVNEFLYYLLPKDPVTTNIQNYVSLGFQTTILSYMMQLWMPEKKLALWIVLAYILICASIWIEVYIYGINAYHFSIIFFISHLFIAMIATRVLIYTISRKNIHKEERIIRLLILLPLQVNFLFSAIVNIVLFFFYNPDSAEFFKNLYWVVTITNALSYIFYTLAFLWTPQKEKFL